MILDPSKKLQVIRMLVGEESLPWEMELPSVLEAKLGKLQRPLLELLVRDSGRRAPLQQIADRCRIIATRSSP